MEGDKELTCYNKGCGQKFDARDNSEGKDHTNYSRNFYRKDFF